VLFCAAYDREGHLILGPSTLGPGSADEPPETLLGGRGEGGESRGTSSDGEGTSWETSSEESESEDETEREAQRLSLEEQLYDEIRRAPKRKAKWVPALTNFLALLRVYKKKH
jgi:hypothetical protein